MGCVNTSAVDKKEDKKKKKKGEDHHPIVEPPPRTTSTTQNTYSNIVPTSSSSALNNVTSPTKNQKLTYKPRGPPPAPNCSRHELQEYLASYSLSPTVAESEEEGEEHNDDRTDEFSKYYSTNRRKTVSDAPFDARTVDQYKPKTIPKSPQEEATLISYLSKCTVFAHLDDRELQTVIQAMERGNYRRGDFVVREGEAKGDEDKLYVIAEGQVSMSSAQKPSRTTITRGEIFGDQDMLTISTRTATYQVDSPTLQTWELTRQDFRHLLRAASMRKRRNYEAILSKIDFLKTLSKPELTQLADCLQPANYKPGEYIIRHGEVGMWMYIILEGKVEVLGRDKNGGIIHVCHFSAGDHIGELEFINKHLTVADVVAVDHVRTAKVYRDHFEKCMGPIIDLLAKNAEYNEKYKYYRDTASKK
eukprot:NODE_2761_length_1499_cov_33.423692_g2382_i0.p1 GENE.NODE_2761_length_1499_cov_33.423692_g2382_i0~~NODE_2761_length_1499_cov_33.423692_g2382_i0.p1  ORF type:complete len:418 (-),score=66.65 NODE_2761_length_1499_cov_33.423692_g2382_i0:197-1450(-)